MGDIASAKANIITVGPGHLTRDGFVVVEVSGKDSEVVEILGSGPVRHTLIILPEMPSSIVVVGHTIAMWFATEPEAVKAVSILEVHGAIAVWGAIAPLTLISVAVKKVHSAVSVWLFLDEETVVASIVEKACLR